jgi:hypothetical protein
MKDTVEEGKIPLNSINTGLWEYCIDISTMIDISDELQNYSIRVLIQYIVNQIMKLLPLRFRAERLRNSGLCKNIYIL